MKFKETYRGEDINLSLGRFYNTDIRKLAAFQLDYPLLFPDPISSDPRAYFTERVQSQDSLYFALRFRKKVVGYGALDPIYPGHAILNLWKRKWERVKKHHFVGIGRLLLQFGFRELSLEKITILSTDLAPTANSLVLDTGFTPEGRIRKFVLYAGELIDVLPFGMLKEEFI